MYRPLNSKYSYLMFRVIILSLFILMGGCTASQPGPEGWASVVTGTTGGAGGDTIRVKNRNDLLKAVKTGSPAVILIEDTINLQQGESITVDANNITILGSGEQATLRYGGLRINGNNVIIRNLSIGDSYIDGHWDGKGAAGNDALSLTGRHIWVDHCDLYHGFDGLLDISRNGPDPADMITVSWTRFRNHNKVMLIGSNDRDTVCRGFLRVTVHHCWFDGTTSFYDAIDKNYYNLTQRMPRVRFGDVHVYNNYYEGVSGYCVAARLESRVVVEKNYFRNLEDPHIIDDAGKGCRDPELVALNNIYDHTRGKTDTGGSAFNPSDHYNYVASDPSEIPTLVLNGAGKINRACNTPPDAEDDTFRLVANTAYSFKPLENDSDMDNDPLRIAAVLNHPLGEVQLLPGEIRYKPPAGGVPVDTIRYRIIDYQGGKDDAIIFVLPDNTL